MGCRGSLAASPRSSTHREMVREKDRVMAKGRARAKGRAKEKGRVREKDRAKEKDQDRQDHYPPSYWKYRQVPGRSLSQG